MTNWKAGDIITDKKWNKLNKVYPLFKKVNITAINYVSPDTYITLDINYDELIELVNNGSTTIWAYEESGHLRFFHGSDSDYEATNDGKTLLTEYGVA